MTELDLFAEQVSLEREQIRKGIDKLYNNTSKLEQKDYASATEYGSASIQAVLPKVIESIDKTRNHISRGSNGPAFKEIKHYLEDVESIALAGIALKVTFDKVFSPKPRNSEVVKVCEAIGVAVQNECQMRHYEKEAPELLNYLKEKKYHTSMGTSQKLKVTRHAMNHCDITAWNHWGAALCTKIGTWLLGKVCESTGWFTREVRQQGRTKVQNVVPTDLFMAVKESVMNQAELFAPIAWPMLVEPNDWSHERDGGYILNEVMEGNKMVRRGNPSSIQGETPYKFLNQIQKTAYRLNPFIVDVAEQLDQRGIQVGKFIPIIEVPLPPKPVDIAENYDARYQYRRKAAEVNNINSQAFRRNCRTRMTMEAVRRFKDVEQFYIPWSFDYRGRAYPIPAFLTPQDTDFGKSLMQFAEGSPVYSTQDIEWLAFQVATTYGLDKAPMKERLTWTFHNHKLLQAIVADPIGMLPKWEDVDEPWCFLASAEEYVAICIDHSRVFTHLPVACDATCSGLQILAGLARDKSTAELVNVLPGSEPQDAYRVIAEESKPHIPEWLRPVWDRKCCKRTVMTVPYNAKPFSNREYIRDALTEKKIEIDKDELTVVVKAVRDAMDRVVPGPMAVMKWIETEVGLAMRRGAKYLEWKTPSDFVVHQKLNKVEWQRMDLQLLGRCQVKVATGESDEVDISHHKSATSPNLIHSLDASLLHLSAIRFNAPLALIHDSVLCRATDMGTLSSIVREVYMYLFAEHNYLKTFADAIGAETEPPMIGDLEPGLVTKSTYFFC